MTYFNDNPLISYPTRKPMSMQKKRTEWSCLQWGGTPDHRHGQLTAALSGRRGYATLPLANRPVAAHSVLPSHSTEPRLALKCSVHPNFFLFLQEMNTCFPFLRFNLSSLAIVVIWKFLLEIVSVHKANGKGLKLLQKQSFRRGNFSNSQILQTYR